MLTGEVFPIFQDREDIYVGQRWRDRILNSINGSTLLVAIITPSFLRSESCRGEVQLFLERERRLERNDLIIPLLYVRTPGLDDPEDEVARDLKDRQYFPWEDLRFEDIESKVIRIETNRLAENVVKAIQRSKESGEVDIAPEDSPIEEGPGFIELLAESENAMPLFIDTIRALSTVAQEIGESVSLATEEMKTADSHGRPSSARLVAVVRLAKRLEKPAAGMEQHADDYLDHLSKVRGGVDALIDRVPDLEQENEIQAAKDLLPALEYAAKNVGMGLDALDRFRQTLIANYQLSSTLRPVLKRMSAAALKIIPSNQVFQEWRDRLSEALEELDKRR